MGNRPSETFPNKPADCGPWQSSYSGAANDEGAPSYSDRDDRRLIKRVARSLKAQFPDAAEDVEDYEQELALRLHVARKAYDPTRSSPQTFAHRVAMSKAASMANARTAQKRRPVPAPPPRPDEIDRERDAEVIDISDLMAVEREKERLSDLEREVAEVQTKLPREQRELCEHLKYGTVTGAAKGMCKSRWWVYEQLEQMRPYFERHFRQHDTADTFHASSVYPFRRKG